MQQSTAGVGTEKHPRYIRWFEDISIGDVPVVEVRTPP